MLIMSQFASIKDRVLFAEENKAIDVVFIQIQCSIITF